MVVTTKTEVRVDSLLTESTWPQIADIIIPYDPIMTNGKGKSLVTVLADDGLFRTNIDCVSIPTYHDDRTLQRTCLLKTRYCYRSIPLAHCPAAIFNCHYLDRLESPEERQLYSAVLGIGPIRIGGARPDRL